MGHIVNHNSWLCAVNKLHGCMKFLGLGKPQRNKFSPYNTKYVHSSINEKE